MKEGDCDIMSELRFYFLNFLFISIILVFGLNTINQVEAVSAETLVETKGDLSVATKEEITPASMPYFNEKAIVIVVTTHLQGVTTGNGFVFGDGTLVATAWHLVADVSKSGDHLMLGEPRVISRYFGDVYDAKIIGTDPDMDIAVLQLAWDKHPALQLATDEELLNAKEVIVTGFPGIEKIISHDTSHLSYEQLPIDEINVREIKSRSILLGVGEKVGVGWSGAPIILPNGKVAGLFSRLQGLPGQKKHPWGCSANAIRTLAENIKDIQVLHSQGKIQNIPKDSETAFVTALSCLKALLQRNYTDALSNAQEFVKLRPDSPKAHTLLASSASYSDNDTLAEEQYKEALKLAPGSSDIHFSYGIFLQNAGRNENALAEYQRAIEIEPNNPSLLLNLMKLLIEFGKEEKAEALGRRAVETEPKNAYLWLTFGNILKRRGKIDEAIQAQTTAVNLKPEMGPLRGSLAHLLEKSERFDEAEIHFRKLLEIEPTNPVVWFWLAKFLREHRPEQRDEALKAIEEAISLNNSQKVPPEELEEIKSKLEALKK